MEKKTLGEFIVAIIAGLIILGFVFMIFSSMSPTVAGFGCGVNVAIKAAFIQGSKGFVDTPLLLCKQYVEPQKINAADFGACPGLADFCDDAKGTLRDLCYQQCARIQIDKLADTCWTIGGEGRYDLTNILDKIGKVAIDTTRVRAKIDLFTTAPISIAVLQAFPETRGKSIDEIINAALPQDTKIIRCFRFQITNPGVNSDRSPFLVSDFTAGKSQLYTDASNRSLGGNGVAAVNPEKGQPAELSFSDAFKLNYKMAEQRQICYISYYQFFISEGLNFEQRAAVVRSCESWTDWTRSFEFMN